MCSVYLSAGLKTAFYVLWLPLFLQRKYRALVATIVVAAVIHGFVFFINMVEGRFPWPGAERILCVGSSSLSVVQGKGGFRRRYGVCLKSVIFTRSVFKVRDL